MRLARLCAAFLPLALLATSAMSRTWHILPDGSGDAPTIQAGIDSSEAGDEILLSDGVFRGPGNHWINPGGKDVTIRSLSDEPTACIVDCDGGGEPSQGFWFCSGETPAFLLRGITVRNAHLSGLDEDRGGAGIRCQHASPTIENCIVRENTCVGENDEGFGGGLLCLGNASPIIRDCRFARNSTIYGGAVAIRSSDYSGGTPSPQFERCVFDSCLSFFGGGIYLDEGNVGFWECRFFHNRGIRKGGAVSGGVTYASVTFATCEFEDNSSAEGGACYLYSSPLIENSLFIRNRASEKGGALVIGPGSSATLRNCTFYGNRSEELGGTAYCFYGTAALEYCIVASSAGAPVVECFIVGGVTLLCVDIWQSEGGDWVGCIADQYGVNGSFSADPLFCNADAGDFTLRSDSPCLPGQHPDGYDCGLIGALGEGCSAPTSVEHTSWGSVKRTFR